MRGLFGAAWRGPHSDERGQGGICTYGGGQCDGYQSVSYWGVSDGPTTKVVASSGVANERVWVDCNVAPQSETEEVGLDEAEIHPNGAH